MTTDVTQLSSRAAVQIRLWLILRLLVPMIVAATVLYLTRGQDYFGVFIPLAWALFAVHLTLAFAFQHTHVLDIGAYLLLFYLSSAVAEISESERFDEYVSWIIMIVLFLVYAFLSLVRRLCAGKRPPHEPVGFAHVCSAFVFLMIALIICSGSKDTVGFLFIPGILVVPGILLWKLLSEFRSRVFPRRVEALMIEHHSTYQSIRGQTLEAVVPEQSAFEERGSSVSS